MPNERTKQAARHRKAAEAAANRPDRAKAAFHAREAHEAANEAAAANEPEAKLAKLEAEHAAEWAKIAAAREGSALKPPVSVWSLFIWDGERDETLPDSMCEDETTEAYADLAEARRTASEILSEVDDFDGPIEWSEDRKTASVSYWNGQRRLTVKICEIHVR